MKIFIKTIILCFILLSGRYCNAQQTVFNVPSADVTPDKAIFLQHESQFRAWNPDAFWLGTHYSALGVGHNTELDATLFNVSAPSSKNISLGLGFKSAMPVFFLKEKYPKREIKLTVGSEVLVSLQGNGVGNWSYAHLSCRLPHTSSEQARGLYWQSLGIKVIPTVGWSDSNSFKYAFLGIENNSTVAISTVGILNNEISKMLFEDGFTEMIKQINPKNILIYGNKLEIFDRYENIKLFEPFHNKWSKKGG